MRNKSWLVFALATFACGGGGGSANPTAPVAATPTPEPSNCQFFPASFVPFVRVHSTIDGTGGNDRMVLGDLAPGASDFIRTQLRLPRSLGEEYCDPVTLAPGLTVKAFVPTVAERNGDYSQFSGTIRDPLTNVPFPNNAIPADRGLLAWRIPGG